MSITPLIGMEDARIVLNVSRPSPKAILNDETRYCLQLRCEQQPFSLQNPQNDKKLIIFSFL